MGARTLARERALQALYQLESGEATPDGALEAAWTSEPESPDRSPEADRFARTLVEGVLAHRDEVDGWIEKFSHNWRIDRMSRIDRSVLRLAVFELAHLADVPRKVTLNEAVELGKKFGNTESSGFINGLLDRIAHELKKA